MNKGKWEDRQDGVALEGQEVANKTLSTLITLQGQFELAESNL